LRSTMSRPISRSSSPPTPRISRKGRAARARSGVRRHVEGIHASRLL
jgi:hypothetical protein